MAKWAALKATMTSLAEAAIAAADPARAVRAGLAEPPAAGRVVVLAAGKASVPMARAVLERWGPLDGRLQGVVVTNDAADAGDLAPFEVMEASHPTPDARSAAAARRLLEVAGSVGPDDLALPLISGGGSALLAAPADGLTLDDKRAVNDALLACGATIHEINAVRKRLSAIKGGRLAAAAHPARLMTLAISDVPGDDPAVIASGPTAPDPTTVAETLRVVAKYGLSHPALTPERLRETPSPGDPIFERASFDIVASPAASIRAATTRAEANGWRVMMLGDAVEGEARDVARAHVAEALAAREDARRAGRPIAFISGGELTVTIAGTGRGGPNREYVLAAAAALAGDPQIAVMALDTDGADGAPLEDGSPAAGAFALPDTAERAEALGRPVAAALADNDSGGLFAALGDDLRTGYTGTNVNDLRVILVAPEPLADA